MNVELFTDGACIGNPGPGGWAFILRHVPSKRYKEGSGGELRTTNNRMEIMAVIKGLQNLKGPTSVSLHSDSQYVVNAINEWMAKWKSFGWRNKRNARDCVKNADLWKELDTLLQVHDVEANWVRGHAGHPQNERCDMIAMEEAKKYAADATPDASVPDDEDGALF